MRDSPEECEPEWLDAEDPLFILYTSGSTGKPKVRPRRMKVGPQRKFEGNMLRLSGETTYFNSAKAGRVLT